MFAPLVLLAQLQPAPVDTPPAPPAAVAAPAASASGTRPRTAAEDRLTVCLGEARTAPGDAMVTAGSWLREAAGGADATYAHQCLGMAYTALLRWEAAEQAFLAARDSAEPADAFRRAQLGTMGANAALAEERGPAALAALEVAARDAESSGNAGLRAMVLIDRARAQVLMGQEQAAEAALAEARVLDPQSPSAWLLSATLARRLGRLDEAQGFITTAAALAPAHLETGLEAGVIAMLSGREATAASQWSSVVQRAPESDEAATARGYLAQLAEPSAAQGAGR